MIIEISNDTSVLGGGAGCNQISDGGPTMHSYAVRRSIQRLDACMMRKLMSFHMLWSIVILVHVLVRWIRQGANNLNMSTSE